jgi:hypothetical protein
MGGADGALYLITRHAVARRPDLLLLHALPPTRKANK